VSVRESPASDSRDRGGRETTADGATASGRHVGRTSNYEQGLVSLFSVSISRDGLRTGSAARACRASRGPACPPGSTGVKDVRPSSSATYLRAERAAAGPVPGRVMTGLTLGSYPVPGSGPGTLDDRKEQEMRDQDFAAFRRPTVARVYGALLGGKTNFQPDRDLAGQLEQIYPRCARSCTLAGLS
jgi:hypothetical protein